MKIALKGSEEQRAAAISAEVNEQRAVDLSAPILFEGSLYDADEYSVNNLSRTLVMLASGMVLPEGFIWRTADNRNVHHDAASLKRLAKAIFERNVQIMHTSWQRKDTAKQTDQVKR